MEDNVTDFEEVQDSYYEDEDDSIDGAGDSSFVPGILLGLGAAAGGVLGFKLVRGGAKKLSKRIDQAILDRATTIERRQEEEINKLFE